MPELPEIARYARNISALPATTRFTRVVSVAGGKVPPANLPFTAFSLSARARGKELRLELRPATAASTATGSSSHASACALGSFALAPPVARQDQAPVIWRCNHGLVGKWLVVRHGPADRAGAGLGAHDGGGGGEAGAPQGTRLMILGESASVYYVDTLNMGRIVEDGWSSGRSPCPYGEAEAWEAHVAAALAKTKRPAVFAKPLADALLDQKYFNGVGNYLRAELMYRLQLDPHIPLVDALSGTGALAVLGRELRAIVAEVLDSIPPLDKYGSDEDKARFEAWLQIYNKGEFYKDGKGRKVWWAPAVQTRTSLSDAPGAVSGSPPPPGQPLRLSFIPPMESSWAEALREVLQSGTIRELESFLASEVSAGKQVFPPREEVFSAFYATPLHAVRVVILGQDPYHDDGQAHGMSFSVKPGINVPPSLANIYRELADDIDGFVAQTTGRGWEALTHAAIAAVAARLPHAVFLAWGSFAQKALRKVDTARHAVIATPHPSPLSASRGFFGSRCFSAANAALVGFGLSPVDWRLPTVPTLTVPAAALPAPAASVDNELAAALAALTIDDAAYEPVYTFERAIGLDMLLDAAIVVEAEADAKSDAAPAAQAATGAGARASVPSLKFASTSTIPSAFATKTSLAYSSFAVTSPTFKSAAERADELRRKYAAMAKARTSPRISPRASSPSALSPQLAPAPGPVVGTGFVVKHQPRSLSPVGGPASTSPRALSPQASTQLISPASASISPLAMSTGRPAFAAPGASTIASASNPIAEYRAASEAKFSQLRSKYVSSDVQKRVRAVSPPGRTGAGPRSRSSSPQSR
ncbi:uracil-DNA glycosylase [Thecamonas trahens ATCC 50062]|uniref:Uracil-DNA glycosylase n=1 Tax=Thecamonas trahens ATCC 50062 TaxID=461836 RepID=A0A0L0DSR6_THETB|nr:uracil-DNA glycosylase [Thecamonas trahens ATCC 50062]KNC55394.1 uracil-DNA glycosylase [Thecamonas trahens ATCC 50062]|eukprot:XP_013753025.1 uracil-DNA glycosylase [Thecamonas trahens ATCC 50062]